MNPPHSPGRLPFGSFCGSLFGVQLALGSSFPSPELHLATAAALGGQPSASLSWPAAGTAPRSPRGSPTAALRQPPLADQEPSRGQRRGCRFPWIPMDPHEPGTSWTIRGQRPGRWKETADDFPSSTLSLLPSPFCGGGELPAGGVPRCPQHPKPRVPGSSFLQDPSTLLLGCSHHPSMYPHAIPRNWAPAPPI